MEVFGGDWARAWMVEINADPSYREAGRGWHAAIVLRMWPEPGREGRSLYVALEDGECRSARVASNADASSAAWVIGAPRETWRTVLSGGTDPITGLVHGKLRLERGNLLQLVPYARAAKVLLSAAGRVPATFPGEAPPDDAASTRNGIAGAGARDVARRGAPAPSGEGSPRSETGRDRRAAGSLDHSLVPMRLRQRARASGAWDPQDLDLDADLEDWRRLQEPERELLIRLAAQFRGGGLAVIRALPPLADAIAGEGRIEDELYLTSIPWEQAKHVETFDRFLAAVGQAGPETARFETPAWRRILLGRLPADMRALRDDPSPAGQVRAGATCHLMVEGVLANTGHHAFHLILERRGILPGMQRAVQYVKRDVARHVEWGEYLIGRLVAELGDPLWGVAEWQLAGLLEPALDVVRETFDAYDSMPFDLRLDRFTDHATRAFRARLTNLESRRRAKRNEVVRTGEV